ncbi:hypothetical protein SHIRM173S_00107 [Streptomyces hirsutus]
MHFSNAAPHIDDRLFEGEPLMDDETDSEIMHLMAR